MMSRLLGWLLIPCLLTAAGCSRRPEKAAPAELSDEQIDHLMRAKQTEDPIERSQVSVGLKAHWAGAGRVMVSIENRTSVTIPVGPGMFRMILPPNRALIAPLPDSQQLFPAVHLKAGEQAGGELRFPAVAPGADARLVFNDPENPDVRAAQTQIR